MMEELDLHISDPERDPQPVALVRVAAVAGLAVVVLGMILLGWLTEEVMEAGPRGVDLSFRNWLHQFASPGRTRAAFFFSLIGDRVLVALFVVSLIAFLLLRWRRAAGWLAVTMGGALALDLALKFGFHRPRPQPFFGTMPHTYSFPSGHALFALCFFGVLAGLLADRINNRGLQAAIWAVAAALIGAIGLSRIYLGVHYPSDVIAGYLTAAVWVSTILVLDHVRVVRNSRKLLKRKTGEDD
ncbi:MAG: phosphatase PAP2 family protein [Acidobacteriia bacterium]|nr:phosphatase PAP2 family protein [Terriglobia bacterium]